MPIKRVDDLIDPGLRIAGQEWQKRLGVRNLTTREWDNAVEMASEGKTYNEIAQQIRKHRRKTS